MHVFQLRDRLIADYSSYISSFIQIKDPRIRQHVEEESLPEKARKLLSFTDNRQDASLQAGHFNDFIEIGLLRSALYRTASAA